jgi:hypothetical protein
MYAELESWSSGWYGLRLSLRSAEIERLISLLGTLQKDTEQHFHISPKYEGEPSLGDIEISVAGPSEPDNMWLSGLALAPCTELPPAGP